MTETALKEKPAGIVVGGKASDLVSALRFAAPAVHDDKTRPYLSAVRIDVDPTGILIRATDGYRLHVTRLTGDYGWSTYSFLLRRADVQTILKTFAIKRSQTGQHWSVDYSSMVLTIGDLRFDHWTGARSDVDFDRIVPCDPPVVFACWSEQLLPLCKAACAARQRSTAIVKFTTDHEAGTVTLTCAAYSGSRRGPQSKLEMRSVIEGAGVALSGERGFNAAYIKDIIAVTAGNGHIRCRQTQPNHPSIWDAGDPDQFVVLMPCRV